ncbi:hypothetical protein RIF29_16982 [Crotalaria pallida]|uniref:HVA22-like protein n=1 Tax=Crotalaria pallida TaxID=3830 RepID=A0AAN9FID4_CROPI
MGWEVILTILTKSLILLAWPPFSLLCPLYASIRVMGSDSRSSNKRCLAFWVLFSLSMIVEREFALIFNRLPWWPQVKSIATILLLIPYSGGPLYICKYLIKNYCTWNIVDQTSTHVVVTEDSHVSDETYIPNQIEEKKLAVSQGRYDASGCYSTKSNYTRPIVKQQVQKEWSCAIYKEDRIRKHQYPISISGFVSEFYVNGKLESSVEAYAKSTLKVS